MDSTLVRITDLMKIQKIQDQQMIEYLGLPKGAFSNWRREKGKSYYEHIDKIADRLGVSIDYLVRGIEVKKDSLESDEAKLIQAYRCLPDEGKDIVIRNTQMLANMTEKKGNMG